MHVVLVYNLNSGSALRLDEIRTLFDKAGYVIDDAIKIDRRIRSKLKKYVAAGATIAVIGGDGTISAVAGIVAGTRAALLPLPGGTLNHFTKDLGINQNLEVAIKKARHGKMRQIDVAMVNDTVFINNSSIGLYPSSLRDRNRFEDRLGKWPAAVVASVVALFRFRVYDVEIDQKSFKTPFVFIGNNKYELQPGSISRKHLDQGVLSVFAVRATSRLAIAKLIPLALIGRVEQHAQFDAFTTSSLTIRVKNKRIHVSHDGELALMKTSLKYQLNKKSLKVLM